MNKFLAEKKIFVITQAEVVNTVGGAITVFVNFCNMLSENGYNVYGLCYNKINGEPLNLNTNVNFINLYYQYDAISYPDSINKFIKDEKPDLLIFFFPNWYTNAKLEKEFDNIPRILMFHSRPDYYFRKKARNAELKLKSYYVNTVAQILFSNYKKLLPEFIQKEAVITIPNSVKLIDKKLNTDIENKKIIYLSRIDAMKGLEFLIYSFKKIASKYPDWTLDIYGQSQPAFYIKKLINLTKKLKISNQIRFMGITEKPIETFLNYDFCAFPSYFEGFPMGLIEAQSVGLPCIGLKGASGVNQLIIDNVNGFLCDENYNDFALKIEKLILDKELRKEFSINAIKNSQRYEKTKINSIWLDVISKIIAKEDLPTNEFEKSDILKYKNFFISKIYKIRKKNNDLTNSFAEKLFSFKTYTQQNIKIFFIYILGIKITYKKRF